MKISITGGTAGIGNALANIYEQDGHEIVRLSRRTGHNIRSVPKIADVIESSDMFINNAQSGYAQTELLFEMAGRWTGSGKQIIIISTMMSQMPVSPLPGLDMDAYRVQKLALEQAVIQLRYRRLGIKFTVIRPGMIATNVNQTNPQAADVDNWARTVVDILYMAQTRNLVIPEFSLGPV